jgi:ribosomal protein L22
MAKLSDETLTMTFQLLRQLADAIEIASATEWVFFVRYGETPRTIGELEELQNARERLNQSYSRLNTLLLRILEAQPIAANAMLDLLATAINNGQANLEAANASIQEIKRGWNLP